MGTAINSAQFFSRITLNSFLILNRKAVAKKETINEVILCPRCNDETQRIKRTLYMRLLPFSRHVICNSCNERYLKALGGYINLSRIRIF